MKMAMMMAALLTAAVAIAENAVTNGPAIPAPRTDWAGGSYHYLMNEMGRSVRGQDFDLVIFGDSITMGWIYPAADKGWPGGCEVWQRHFGRMLTANFGVSGDRTEHVLWRIVSAGQADGWTAKTIVLMIGINNHGQMRPGWAASDTPAQAAEGAGAIVAALKAKHPESRLVVLGALPWASNDGFRWVRDYNALLKGLCDEKTVFFRDIGGAFLEAPDVQKASLFRDGLHPNPAGYEVYAAELGKILYRLDGGLKSRVLMWGYVLDSKPTACPFVFGRTDVSLEDAIGMMGASRTVYMNSMFNREHVRCHFPKWDGECMANCIDNKLSDAHLEKLRGVGEVWCAVEHDARYESAMKIARLSLKYPNIVGVNFDDFNDGNPFTAMSPAEMHDFKAKIRAVNPKLKVMVVSYYRAPGGEKKPFDLTPFRDDLDAVSRWRWEAEPDYWRHYREDIADLRRQVGDRVRIVQGLYLHDFGRGMDSTEPLPLDIFKLSCETAFDAVRDGVIDGVILPQVGWYAMPTHKAHVDWLKARVTGDEP